MLLVKLSPGDQRKWFRPGFTVAGVASCFGACRALAKADLAGSHRTCAGFVWHDGEPIRDGATSFVLRPLPRAIFRDPFMGRRLPDLTTFWSLDHGRRGLVMPCPIAGGHDHCTSSANVCRNKLGVGQRTLVLVVSLLRRWTGLPFRTPSSPVIIRACYCDSNPVLQHSSANLYPPGYAWW